MKADKKKTLYICQISSNFLKVVKCLKGSRGQREFVNFETDIFSEGTESAVLSEKLGRIFKKLKFHNEPIILSLPINHVTCRYLKVPTHDPSEIQKIISLQASTYLPYAAHDLITAYQLISTDKEGYSYINVIIASQELIKRYIDILTAFNPAKLTIALSSYGLTYLFNSIKPQEHGAALLVDIDATQVDLSIVSADKLLLSRYFKLPPTVIQLENLFLEEINKTRKEYEEEVSKEKITKIFVFSSRKIPKGIFENLSKNLDLTFEILSFGKDIGLGENLLGSLLNSDYSFVNLFGLGVKDNIEESLNLIPYDLKEKERKDFQGRDRIRLVVSILGILAIFGMAAYKNLDNKAYYLSQLKAELKRIEKDAKVFESLDRRLSFLESRTHKKVLIVDVLYELHHLLPDDISLNTINYEEDKNIILKGQAQKLNSVFECVANLEKAQIFKNFNIKIKYTTKKQTPTGEVADFEIDCIKRA